MTELVYFIQAGEHGPIKIGSTSDINRRLSELRTSSSSPLSVLGILTGGKTKERELHEKFAATRTQGEWFSAQPELLSWVRNNTDTPSCLPKTRQPKTFPPGSELSSTADVIDAIGGHHKVANLTGRKYTAAWNWKTFQTFPSNTYLVMQAELTKRGYTAPAALWGMIPFSSEVAQ